MSERHGGEAMQDRAMDRQKQVGKRVEQATNVLG